MGLVAFNTYDFVKSLEDAGLNEKQAAAISAGILRSVEVADLVTRADLRESQAQMKADLRAEMQEVKADLQAQMQGVKAEIQEVKADLQGVKADLQEMKVQAKADLRELELRMTIKLGSMLIVAVGVLGVMMKLL